MFPFAALSILSHEKVFSSIQANEVIQLFVKKDEKRKVTQLALHAFHYIKLLPNGND